MLVEASLDNMCPFWQLIFAANKSLLVSPSLGTGLSNHRSSQGTSGGHDDGLHIALILYTYTT
jgi:hypothetical protein